MMSIYDLVNLLLIGILNVFALELACLFLCLPSVFSGLISAFEASLFLVFSFFGTAEKDLKYVEESFYCFIL